MSDSSFLPSNTLWKKRVFGWNIFIHHLQVTPIWLLLCTGIVVVDEEDIVHRYVICCIHAFPLARWRCRYSMLQCSSSLFQFSFKLFVGSFRPLCVQCRQAESILWNVMWKLLWSHASYINHQNDTLRQEAIARWNHSFSESHIKEGRKFTTVLM